MNSVLSLAVAAFFFSYLRLTRSESICCHGIRCYSNDPPFRDLPLPQCPETMGVNMTLYTLRNPTEGQPINRTFIPSVFNGTLMTMFIVPGWLQTGYIKWLYDMKDAALTRGDFNVIIVSWKAGSLKIYEQSASNTRTVGLAIALVANNTINQAGSSQSRLYCVGNSLGAHVCGHAGQHLKFGRITGLDPAGPLFEDRDWSAGLNPSCADLVDVIHVDGKSFLFIPNLGTMKVLGHVDFYPNGGANQPGCVPGTQSPAFNFDDFTRRENNTLTVLLDKVIGCSHGRAIVYFIESLKTPCFLSRRNCSSVDHLPLRCSSTRDPIQSLGLAAKDFSARGIFYLVTKSKSPFCVG